VVFFAFSHLLAVDQLRRWLVFSVVIILLAINLGNLGLGYVYWGGAGTLGLMPYGTQNSLSTIVVVFSAFLSWQGFVCRQYKYFFGFFFAVLAAWTMGSKFALFGSLLVGVVAFVFGIRRTYLTVAFSVVSVPLLAGLAYMLIKDSGALSRLDYHYQVG